MPLNIGELTIRTINSVAELMDLNEEFIHLESNEKQYKFAFRGQPQEFQTLVPSFRRLFSTNSHSAAELIERELITAFRSHYATLPDRNSDMPDPCRLENGFDLRCLSVMQHYEVPTRLLDWTTSFWVAIYFACATDPGNNAELWVYNRAIFNDQLICTPEFKHFLNSEHPSSCEPNILGRRGEKLLIELDPKITPRMRQQYGHHTVSADVFQDHAHLLFDLTEQKSTTPDTWNFKRSVITSPCKGKALKFLADHKNITASTIFPDVVGLGRFLRWQLESLRTMLL